ncbi:endo-1,4-beta-xylanase [Protaetiibacter sp. SSC-01]|uniref:endo-1,4-beta-xylanase n=1 Tax=Protaetiibacter sp. SSC-01 TaxID=2759943 RepID=UPI001656F5EA|nr:endo-1,4-beta-xylanase [Protaetiibacter sp. SSC-01]QNO37161.1 endo-1,4-beta-xylanase [Protaetiibacter sp. SSC-01]
MLTSRRIETFAATIAAVALAAGSLFAVSAAQAADVAVVHTDFEDGTLGGWEQSGGDGSTLSVVDLDGSKVLQVADRAADYVGVQTAAGALTSLEEGQTYTFSMRARLADGVSDKQFRWVMKPAYTWIGPTTVTAGAWTTVTGTYTVPADADTSALQVYIGTDDPTPAGAYTYYVDDLTITGPPVGPTVTTVTAVDFEDGTTGTWQQSGGDGSTLSVIDLDGGKVLQVADRSADYVGIQSPTGVFEPATEYTFSMRVRLAPGTPGTNVRFVMKPPYNWIADTAVTADAWTTVSGTYTTPADGDPATLQVYIGTGDLATEAPYTYYVDDILVTTEDDAGPAPDPDVTPGGAVNPTTTPTTLAQGTGDVAALSFDDGPNGDDTAELLDFLKEKDIKAVFCVIGQNIEAPGGATLLRRIVAEGHTLCNHTTSYADMGSWSTTAIRDDLVENLRIIREALGDPNAKVPFFRAPNGSWGSTPGVAVSLGMQPLAVINTISDWETQNQATLETNLRAAIKPGQIVLVHDGGGDRSGSIAAVKTVVQERLDAGWTFTLPVGTPPPGGQVALSTDFEEGLDGWEPRAAAGGAPVVEIVTDPVHGGAQAATVTQRPDEGAGIRHEVTGILEPGVTYELTAWLRFADDGPVGDVWLSSEGVNGDTSTYSTLGQFTGMSKTDWVQVTQRFTLGESERTYIYFETAYQVPNTTTFYIDDIVVSTPAPAVIQDLEPIHETVDFPVGVAVDSRETLGGPAQLTLKHFDQLTPENHMKPEAWYDAERNFRLHPEAKSLMDFAQENGLRMYGHVLVWHSQTPEFLFQDDGGTPLTSSPADQDILDERLRTHIYAVAKALHDQYGDFGSETNPLVAFDVVNEVVADSGDNPDGLRRSEWFRILGEEFIDAAFHYADEAFNELYAAPGSDRPVKLFINDYNTEQSGKQQRYHALVERLLERGVPIDGVGHQFHVSLSMPVTALADALEAFEDTGLLQAVTELDVTTGTPVTQAKLVAQGYYYRDAFWEFRDFQARTGDMFSVTVWGLTDGRSWRNSNGAPLVFDDGLQAKPAYYGIVDAELPAPLRTANVFRADILATTDGLAAAEWDRLPLIAISADARFQSRWSPDRLTVLVEVDDLSAGNDSIELQLGDETVTLGRNGSGGATGVVAETATGYRAIVELPLDGAAEADTLALDVRVTDGLSTVAWNAPGETGTLTLLEALSFLEVVQADAAPQIDGTVDDVWEHANVVTTSKHVEGSGAEATVRTLWRAGTLYVLAAVADPVVDVSGSDPWIQDSVELYIDPGNVKNGSYRYDDSQIRISATNVLSFGTGDEAFQRGRVQSATSTVDGGYVVEAAITLGDAGVLGSFHGVDFQVNDAQGGARIGIANWADPSGAGYQSTARWGVGQLVGPAGPEEPGEDRPTVTLGSTTVRAGGQVDVELSGFEPGTVVELQLDRPAAAAGGGSGGAPATARTASAAALPATLGTLLIGPDGTASGSVTIPSDTTPGSYRIAAYVDGSLLASGQLTVLAAAVAATGADVSGALGAALLMLLAGGAALVLRARRRESALRRP